MINETEGMQDGVSDPDNAEFRHIWYEQIKIIDEKITAYDPQYSQMSAVK